jgi:hypothetical protein
MLILFDHGVPTPLRASLVGNTVKRTHGMGYIKQWELLDAAEKAGIETDKNIRYQQNLKGRKIAIVVLGNPQWPVLRRHVDRVVVAVNAATPGSYTEVDIPNR